tara:strand:- start:506 stop:982 length:477 start_codon:yes stop_codon:yes gene_type:complete
MITFKNVIDLFESIVSKHFQLKTFQTGELSEVDVNKLNQQDFPLLFLEPNNTTIDVRTLNYSVDIYILTQVLDDGTSTNDSYSQTLLIMQDVVAEFRQILSSSSFVADADKHEYIIELPIICEPFTERFANLLTGWNTTITIEVSNANNLCIAPISNS